MLFMLLYFLITSVSAAVPLFRQKPMFFSWKGLQTYRLDKNHPLKYQNTFTLPGKDEYSTRTLEIEKKRQGYLYGPSLLGNTSYFPTGVLGDAMVQKHIKDWLDDAAWITAVVEKEANAALVALKNAGSSS